MEDQYEELILSENTLRRSDQLLSAFFRNVRAQFQYRTGLMVQFESYWTRSGARVPLVLRNNEGALGFSILEGDNPTLSQRRSADSFLLQHPEAKMMYLSDNPRIFRLIDARNLVCPISAVI